MNEKKNDTNAADEVLKVVDNCCNSCGKEAEKRCSTCGEVYYSSVKCQRNDWSSHKKVCGGGYVFKVVSHYYQTNMHIIIYVRVSFLVLIYTCTIYYMNIIVRFILFTNVHNNASCFTVVINRRTVMSRTHPGQIKL